MSQLIYLDYAATTPVDPLVAKKMFSYLMPDGIFGNPASQHSYGVAAKNAVDNARQQIAHAINAEPTDIIFTGSATEAINLALKGAAQLYQQRGRHIVTLKTEHSATIDTCQWLEKNGFSVTYLTPEKNGQLDLQKFSMSLRADTILVSILHVNNETGIIQNIAEIAKITANKNILLHIDAAQSIGKTLINMKEIPIDLMSLCAHKVYGPKGIGALYLRHQPKIRLACQIHGGGQEKGMRSGTLPPHQIVGMGEAYALAEKNFATDILKIKKIRDQFIKYLSQKITFSINGDLNNSVPHILNLCFENPEIANFVKQQKQIAISTGSACHGKSKEPSPVLRAMGLSTAEANRSIRFSFGRFTTQTEIEQAVELIVAKNPRQTSDSQPK